MRTRTSPENTILAAAFRWHSIKLEIKDAAGVWQDLTEFVLSASFGADVDQPIAEARVQLRRDDGADSLSPFRSDSPLNSGGAAIDAGREIRISPATSAYGTAPSSGDFKQLFLGVIDTIDFAGSKMEVIARDMGGTLVDAWIEADTEYATDVGEPLEDVIQDVLDDWAPAVTLDTPLSPGFNVVKYRQEKSSVFEVLRTLAGLPGWDIRYVWDDTTSAFQLMLFEPDRTKTTPDWTFAADRYFDITQLEISREFVRNYIVVTFTNASTGVRESVFAQDTTSIARFGRRWMEIEEASDSSIDTTIEAQALADAALSDLAWPIAEQEIEMPFFWPVDLGDLLRFTANDVHSDGDLDLAVTGYQHELSAKKERTLIRVRGKPAGFYRDWIRRGSASPGQNATPVTGQLWTVVHGDSTADVYLRVTGPLSKFPVIGRIRQGDPSATPLVEHTFTAPDEEIGPLDYPALAGITIPPNGSVKFYGDLEDVDGNVYIGLYAVADKSGLDLALYDFAEKSRDIVAGTVTYQWRRGVDVKRLIIWSNYRTLPLTSSPWPTAGDTPTEVRGELTDYTAYEEATFALPASGSALFIQVEPRALDVTVFGEFMRAIVYPTQDRQPITIGGFHTIQKTYPSADIYATVLDPEGVGSGTLYAWIDRTTENSADQTGPATHFIAGVNLTSPLAIGPTTDFTPTGGGAAVKALLNVVYQPAKTKTVGFRFISDDERDTGIVSYTLEDFLDLVNTLGQLKADSVNDALQIATSIRPPGVGATLPADGSVFSMFLLTSDTPPTLYRWDGSAWTKAVQAVDIDGELVETQIANAAVTTAKIADAAVAAGKIAASAVTETELANIAVTVAKIADNAVTTAKIDALAITSGKIAAGAVTAGKIAALSISAGDIAAATITGAKIAAGTIQAVNIAAGTITSNEIAALTITASNIAAGTITGSKIAATTITASNIAALTITSSEIAANAITSGKINTGAVTATAIAADAVTAVAILAGAVTASKISVATLSAITADLGTVVTGLINNASSSPTAGIRLDSGSSKPGTWTSYIDLAATGTNPFLQHSALTLLANGTATFSGTVSSTSFTGTTATFDGTLAVDSIQHRSGSYLTIGAVSEMRLQANVSTTAIHIAYGQGVLYINPTQLRFWADTGSGVGKQTVTGDKFTNPDLVLGSLLSALSAYNLITDSTT